MKPSFDDGPAIAEWAQRHGVRGHALVELLAVICPPMPAPMPPEGPPGSESWVQSVVRLDAAKHGARLYRNNVGALLDTRGVPVRFGLANDSPEVNKVWKSGDLIGIRPVTINADMVGRVVGQFVSREVKRPGWVFKGTARETAQRNWAALINSLGGDAAIVTGSGSFDGT